VRAETPSNLVRIPNPCAADVGSVATIRERSLGVWEVRTFTGRDAQGRPTQVSRTVRGGKRAAERVAAELTLRRGSETGKVTVSELLDLWMEQNAPTWSPSTVDNYKSRVAQVKADPIAKARLVKLSAVDVDLWHARLVRNGSGEGAIRNQHQVLRAAVTQAARWGWVTTNVVAVATLGKRKLVPRGALTEDEVRRVLAVAGELAEAMQVEPAAPVALLLAAVTGARRSELAALRWEDLDGDRLAIDSSVAIIRHGTPEDRKRPTLRDDPTKTANRTTVTLALWMPPRPSRSPGCGVCSSTSVRGSSTWVSARSARSGSGPGGTGPGTVPGSTPGGGSMTCGTGRPPCPSLGGTTSGR